MIVLKFGGTSVGTPDSIKAVLEILQGLEKSKIPYCSVFSAMSGMTNLLISMSHKAASGDSTYRDLLQTFEKNHLDAVRALVPVKVQSGILAHLKTQLNELEDMLQGLYLIRDLSNKSLDAVVSMGERLSVYIITQAGLQRGMKVAFADARKLIRTDDNFGSARIDFDITDANIADHFRQNTGTAQFITGFIARNNRGETTTLGRGGSDYTAAVVAAALDADEVQIWTDVSGVMTADPRRVPEAFCLPQISYEEAMEMSHFGAKVIYPPTLQPVFNKKIPIRIKNTFRPEDPGTLIGEKSGPPQLHRVKGISSINDITLLTVQGSGMVGVPGIAARLFNALANRDISVVLITQASSEHSISIAIEPSEALKARIVLEEEFYYEIKAHKIDPVRLEKQLSIVALIGENMRHTPGIAGKMFWALGNAGVNICAIAQGSSELNISAAIHKDDLDAALNALHQAFFARGTRVLNLFLMGPGLVGGAFLKQLAEETAALKSDCGLELRLCGLANSRMMIVEEEGILPEHWEESLSGGEPIGSAADFFEAIRKKPIGSGVLVDCTAGEAVADLYPLFLENGYHVVTANKVANSRSAEDYVKLREAAARGGAQFRYEANVGAGLPIIDPLKKLVASGDEIANIEGVLSGSLSFIFNNYDGSRPFAEVVAEAREKGYTEPDPRDDLNGRDVARKILILAREAGIMAEPAEVRIDNILPQSCLEAPDVDTFFRELARNEALF
nr:bifunctional aspartate kinase/homoserine dehydrogenase I [Calditrichia bacterium]